MRGFWTESFSFLVLFSHLLVVSFTSLSSCNIISIILSWEKLPLTSQKMEWTIIEYTNQSADNGGRTAAVTFQRYCNAVITISRLSLEAWGDTVCYCITSKQASGATVTNPTLCLYVILSDVLSPNIFDDAGSAVTVVLQQLMCLYNKQCWLLGQSVDGSVGMLTR